MMSTPADRGCRRAVLRAGLLLPAALALAAACEGRKPPSREPAPPQVIDLLVESDGDLLEYRQKELTVPAGARVRLTFHHTGQYVNFEHNWVLIVPHSFDAVTKEAEAAGEAGGWLPPRGDSRVLAASPMCGRGQSVTIEFTAPDPGDYPYICTFPGHAGSMWGVLHVTRA